MTTTLTQIQSCWVTSSQAALSTMDAAASHPMARCRGSAVWVGSHWNTVKPASPR